MEQCCNNSKQHRNNVATLYWAKHRRCELTRVTSPLSSLKRPLRTIETLQSCLRIRLKKICGFINARIRVDLVWFFNRNFRFSRHVNDKYRKFADSLEVGLWLRKNSWLRTCRDSILLLFLLGIHEVEVCYPSLSLLKYWCQHLCLVNPDKSNCTNFKINSGESLVWVVA